ncbi:MAG: Hint domain-containing protein [Anaerolineae bacterium]
MRTQTWFLLPLFLLALMGASACTTLPAAAGRTEVAPPAVVETDAPTVVALAATATPGPAVQLTAMPGTMVMAGTVMPFSGTPGAARTVAPPPIPTFPSPAPGQLSVTDLRYAILARFGSIFFCDPDSYPVARDLPPDEIARRVGEIQKVPDMYQAILKHLGIAPTAPLTADQAQPVYAEYKKLNAIPMQPAANGYQFSVRTGSGRTGTATTGLVDFQGNITITNQQATILTCPICLTAGTLIATPNGDMPVQDLRQGMAVWTIDARGTRQAGIIQQTVARPLSPGALLVRLGLDDGRTLFASPAHPTVDGRPLGSLWVGDVVDGAHVSRIETVPNEGGATYDILPSGDTGAYWANGILLGSTLAH